MSFFKKLIHYNILPETQKDKIYTEIETLSDSLHFQMQNSGYSREFWAEKDGTILIISYKKWTHFVNKHRRGISYNVRIYNDGTIKSCGEKFVRNDKFAKAIYEMFRSKWREQENNKR